MATIENEVKVLIECVRVLARHMNDPNKAKLRESFNYINQLLHSLARDDGPEATPKPEKCGHKMISTQWLQPQKNWESVLCQDCGVVGRVPYGKSGFRECIEWWP